MLKLITVYSQLQIACHASIYKALYAAQHCLSVLGCKVHIIRITKKYQEHQSHPTALNGEYTVLYQGITPQWIDLTYIVANGNFWIWLINWWCKDEIMYEIMFHVVVADESTAERHTPV